MAGIFNLEKWLVNALAEAKKSGITQDIHISELDVVDKNTPIENIDFSISIFRKVTKILQDVDSEGIGVFLSIELQPSLLLGNIPNSIEEVAEQYNKSTVPEIIIYKPYNSELPNKLQFYRCPILLFNLNKEDKFMIFYKEYRTIDEMIDNEDFHRELNIVYMPVGTNF
jgi:protein-tyrosine phosphatase